MTDLLENTPLHSENFIYSIIFNKPVWVKVERSFTTKFTLKNNENWYEFTVKSIFILLSCWIIAVNVKKDEKRVRIFFALCMGKTEKNVFV